MKITLQNIGIIKNSDIQLDGLTVITGKNNSGKTTVGKVVYSLLDAVSNIQNKARNDRIIYIMKKIEEIESSFNSFLYFGSNKDIIKEVFGAGSSINLFFSRNYMNEMDRSNVEKFVHELFDEFSSIDYKIIQNNNDFFKFYNRIISKSDNHTAILDMFKLQVNKALEILNNLFTTLDKDLELIEYTRESINQTLRIEFANQIQPVIKDVKKSKIELTQNDTVYFSLSIEDNKVLNDGNPIFISSPYSKVYFIDNPFIIDLPAMRAYRSDRESEGTDTLLNIARITTHDNSIRFVLRSPKKTTVFEDVILNESLDKIKKQIEQVIPGQFEFNNDGDYYVKDGSKLKVANLATGSKMFSILKILLEKGEISANTMLILDEPEAHLHPSWQNKFAEIIVLLVKELNTNILLTTHSPNFMLAIDAYMRKYKVSSKTNFYQTNCLEDGFVEYQCVNNDMGKIYADFMQYLSEVKILRNEFIEN